MAGKKILMLTGEFTEEYEIFVFQQGMEAVGHTVHVVCPDKKAGEKIQTSLHDLEGHQTYIERFGHFADINKTFSEAEKQLDQYDAVYCAGGRGPEYIRTDKRIQAMVRHFHETKKPIFTICHGVQILVADGDTLARGLAMPVFEPADGGDETWEPRMMAAGDVDGDGATDLVLVAFDRVLIYLQETR